MPGMELSVGARLGHYEILGSLGVGVMGLVYRARYLKAGRSVALKILAEALAYESQELTRFEREARSASALNHPSICTIYEIGEDAGRVFIAMEFLDGQPLNQRIGGPPMPMGELVDLVTQIADAPEVAHSTGII